MRRALLVRQCSPGITVQDAGRPGFLALGLSRGGAMDRLAMAEGAALLGQPATLAALELAGASLLAEACADLRIALTGAPMKATLDGAALAWNASHAMPAGSVLSLSPIGTGGYGYLHLGGGIETPEVLGSRGAHIAAGLGGYLAAGTVLPVGTDTGTRTGWTLTAEDRVGDGPVRILPSLQTAFFTPETLARFQATVFHKDNRANRMGARMIPQGDGFASPQGLSILSEAIAPGDIQITGDGTPFVLLVECQTTGGYPRVGSVLPCDLARVAQAPTGHPLRFAFIDRHEAIEIERKAAARRAALATSLRPLVRDPARMPDLLSYNLVSGVTAGDDLERSQT